MDSYHCTNEEQDKALASASTFIALSIGHEAYYYFTAGKLPTCIDKLYTNQIYYQRLKCLIVQSHAL